MKITNVNTYLHQIGQKWFSLLATMAIGILPLSAMAGFSPARTTFTYNPDGTSAGANYVTFNSFTNNPVYKNSFNGDERYFADAKTAAAGFNNGFSDTKTVTDGERISLRAYVHNNANPGLNASGSGIAQNVKVCFALPQSQSTNHVITSTISSSNANPNLYTDTINLNATTPFELEYIAGSARTYNNAHIGGIALSDSIISNNCASLGYETMNGQIPGCNQYANYVLVDVLVKMPKLDLAKQISTTNDWTENVALTPNQTANYKISFNNSGSANANNVVIRDVLPANTTLVSGSVKLYNAASPAGVSLSDSELFSANGVNVGNYAPNTGGFITFSFRTDSNWTAGTHTRVNTAYASFQGSTQTLQDPATYTVTVNNPKVDLAIDKAIVSPTTSTIKTGEVITYNLKVTNQSSVNATGVSVKDNLPAGLEFVSANNAAYNNTTGIWTIGALNAGQSVEVRISAKVTATSGKIVNYAQINTTDQEDIDSTPGDNSGSSANSPSHQDDDDSVEITISNPSYVCNSLQTNVTSGSAPVTVNFIANASANGTTIKNYIFDFGDGSNVTATNSNVSHTYTKAGNYKATVIVVTDDGRTVVSEACSKDITVTPHQEKRIDLELDKSVNKNVFKLGDEVTYTISVINKGPDAATGVAVGDNLPAGLVYISSDSANYNNATGIWTIGSIAVNETKTLKIIAKTSKLGTIDNVAEVISADQIDIDSTTNNHDPKEDDQDHVPITVNPAPKVDLELDKSASVKSYKNGDEVTYTITVNNKSNTNATGVSVIDRLNSKLEVLNVSTTAGNYNSSTGLWTIGSINANSKATLTIKVKVNGCAVITNRAQVNSVDQEDIDSTPNNSNIHEDDDDAVVIKCTNSKPKVDLEVNKSVSKSSVNVGEGIVYTVTVKNLGPDAATGVELTDKLPTGLEYQSYSTDAGSYNSSTGLWQVGQVNVGQSLSLRITVKVTASGDINNIAQVTKADQEDVDSNPDDNKGDDYDNVVIKSSTPVVLGTNTTSYPSSLPSTGNATILSAVLGSAVLFWLVYFSAKRKKEDQA